jgi:hypothetical protein
MTYRKQSSATFVATVVLVVVLAAYPVSFGPACWLVNRHCLDIVTVARTYRPFVRMAAEEGAIASVLKWYGDLDRPGDTPKTTISMVGWMNVFLSLYDAGDL